ncbi:lysozyme inhibitor LprI family protein [Maricaulis sp.]|uniref:lysozyme inhibitor LprI family protein n=1 Tax=Maricaulis sp. TaxID=1486257 RepID=UPI002B272993|nr:lysozyme inhibitor LprI family protein [Maricaulis sp.]
MRRYLCALIVGLMVAGCGSAPAEPQPGGMDRLSAYDTIDACLYRHPAATDRAVCIGEFSQACEQLAADGETTTGMLTCRGEEFEAWDRWLNESYLALRESLAGEAVVTLREAQRSWIAHRDQDCLFLASLYAGGTLERVEQASCLSRKTAERAIELMHWDADYPPF